FRYQTLAELAEACGNPAIPGVNGHAHVNGHAKPTFSRSPAASAAPAPAPAPKMTGGGALVESLGMDLPPKEVSTPEVLEGCKNKLDFPLERMTGIRARRMAGETEFAIDLAAKAVADCLARSRYQPADIDLLLSCNI